MKRVCSSILVAALAACGPADTDPGPGGVTVGEARALDEAAEMLEQRRQPSELPAPESPPEPTSPEPTSPELTSKALSQ